ALFAVGMVIAGEQVIVLLYGSKYAGTGLGAYKRLTLKVDEPAATEVPPGSAESPPVPPTATGAGE
ncbi:MAG: hypothetical protein WBV96_16930, partial [Polyangia bacterium]